MFFPPFFPVSLLQITTVLLASILQIHGAQQGTWGWPPARVWLEAVSCRGEKLGVAFCLEQKASSLPGWRRGGMRAQPCPQEAWPYSQPNWSSGPPFPAPPLQQVEIMDLLKASGWAVKGWICWDPRATHCVLFVYLCNTPCWCCAESSSDLLLFLLICSLLQGTHSR